MLIDVRLEGARTLLRKNYLLRSFRKKKRRKKKKDLYQGMFRLREGRELPSRDGIGVKGINHLRQL